jgi:hypothetical protein
MLLLLLISEIKKLELKSDCVIFELSYNVIFLIPDKIRFFAISIPNYKYLINILFYSSHSINKNFYF